jgi:hypothetical protein
MSQERLALDAEISTRHLSCLETGRASPSRTMVLLLGSSLELPLRERNRLLSAAGFAPAYAEEPLEAPEAATLKRAVDHVLRAMEPNGAVAVDRAGNVLSMNRGATALLSAFVDLAAAPPEVLGNVLVAALHPLGLRPSIVNFEETAAILLERARRETARYADDPEVQRVGAMVASIEGLPRRALEWQRDAGPFLTVHLRRGDLEARVFTTLASIGTPMDATAEELAIETYFPADDATAALFRRLAAS